MKRSGRCPKCQSLAVACGPGGSLYIPENIREYTVYVCLDCGYEEHYKNAPREQLGDGFALVNPPPAGPFR